MGYIHMIFQHIPNYKSSMYGFGHFHIHTLVLLTKDFPEFFGLFLETIIPHFGVYEILFNLHGVQGCDMIC